METVFALLDSADADRHVRLRSDLKLAQ